MNRHFDFLFKDQAEEFFQKVAMAEVGIPATIPVLATMTKTASAKTDFEKVASRLDRDIGILKTAGECGLDLGMCKRAEAYIEVLFSNTSLTPAEFGEVFDKVAGEAIDTDMNAAWEDLSATCPKEFHPWLEVELSKVGYELTSDALLAKEASFAAIAKGLLQGARTFGSQARTGASVLKGTLKAAPGKGIAAVSGGVGKFTAGSGARTGARLRSQMKSIVGRGSAQALARKSLGQRILKADTKRERGLLRQQRAATKLRKDSPVQFKQTQADKDFLAKAKRRGKGVPGTTMAGKSAPKLDDIAAAKQKQTAATAEKAQAELRVLQGGKGKGKGTGTDGPAPKSTPKPDSAKTTDLPASAPDAVKADPKLGESWKKMTSGQPLTPEERGGLISAGIKGAIGYRLVTGGGVVTGGEGII